MASPILGIKAAIDSGVVAGPRLHPSSALLSQTTGHGDFGAPYARPTTSGGRASHLEEISEFTVVNGVPEVLAPDRESAWTDLLVVGGDPTTDVDVLNDFERNLLEDGRNT